ALVCPGLRLSVPDYLFSVAVGDLYGPATGVDRYHGGRRHSQVRGEEVVVGLDAVGVAYPDQNDHGARADPIPKHWTRPDEPGFGPTWPVDVGRAPVGPGTLGHQLRWAGQAGS